MKTFQQFNEDLDQLQANLNTLKRTAAPKKRLRARNLAANNTSRTAAFSFKKKSLESMQQQRERAAQRRKEYLEQQKTNR